MRTIGATRIIDSGWNLYFITDPEGLPAEPVDIVAPPNGLAGLLAPSYVTVRTGTHYGPIRIIIEVHDQAPEPDLNGWTDIVELPFRVVGYVAFATDGGQVFYRADVARGAWRLRVHARGRDAGAAGSWEPFDPEEGPEQAPAEEHLLQLFPGVGDEVVYKAEDDFGKRGRYTPAPAEPPAPPPPGPTIDEVLRGVLPNLPNPPRLSELPEGAPGVVKPARPSASRGRETRFAVVP